MKVLIVGCGNAGQRHGRLCWELGHEVIAYDTRPVSDALRAESFARFFTTLQDALSDKPDAVILATPPETHASLAGFIMGYLPGVSLLTEKPLALTYADAVALVELAEREQTPLAVGYQLLASEAIEWAGSHDWRHLTIWDEQEWTRWPAATYQRDFLAEFSHELALAVALTQGATLTLHGVRCLSGSMQIMLSCEQDRMIDIRLRHDSPDYRRGFSIDRHEYSFTPETIEPLYETQLEAFFAGRPICDGRLAMRVCRLMEAIHEYSRGILESRASHQQMLGMAGRTI